MQPVIEILFPDVCNLFGDLGNVKYLEHCIPDAQFIKTQFKEKPYFIDNKVDMIYLGAMTENVQCELIKQLMPYKDKLKDMIDSGVIFIVTGNAVEIFGESIDDSQNGKINCLNLIDFHAKRDLMKRFSGLILGTYENIEIVGFRAQFTKGFVGENSKCFVNIEKGVGMNDKTNQEGIVVNNFYGTYILGPLLVLNPHFTKMILKKLYGKDMPLAFEDEAIKAYNSRLADFKDKRVGIH